VCRDSIEYFIRLHNSGWQQNTAVIYFSAICFSASASQPQLIAPGCHFQPPATAAGSTAQAEMPPAARAPQPPPARVFAPAASCRRQDASSSLRRLAFSAFSTKRRRASPLMPALCRQPAALEMIEHYWWYFELPLIAADRPYVRIILKRLSFSQIRQIAHREIEMNRVISNRI